MPDTVIIVAGGSGNRFGGDVPKQFVLLHGLPVLMQTMSAFYSFSPGLEIIVVLPEDQVNTWESMVKSFAFKIPHRTTTGGKERFHSVRAGLSVMSPEGVVAVHDAVRPLVSHETIQRCFMIAHLQGNAVPVIRPVDSLRYSGTEEAPLDRELIRIVQTPQCFRKDLILAAFEQEYEPRFTDDATVFESSGHRLNLVEGNRENLKITDRLDLKIAEALFVPLI